MKMIGHGARFVTTDSSMCEHAMPKLGIIRAASRSGAESLVEKSAFLKHFSPERHAGAGSNLPYRASSRMVGFKKTGTEIYATIASAESPIGLKVQLSLCLKLRRQNQTCNSHHLRHIKGTYEPIEPPRMKLYVVVSIRNDFTDCCPSASIPSKIQSGSLLSDVIHAGR